MKVSTSMMFMRALFAWLFFIAPIQSYAAPAAAAPAIQNNGAYSADSLLAADHATTSDLSAHGLLSQIFGEIANNPMAAVSGSGGAAAAGDVLGTVFMFINMGLLTLGGIYLSYKGLAAITHTAHEGEFMGKSFNSVWVPIRISTGILSLIPVVGGWSILQVFMLWFGIMGAGLGNMAWQAAVGADFKPFRTATMVPPKGSSSDKEFVLELFKMNVCVAAHNAQYGSSANYARAETPLAPNTNRSYSYGSVGGKNKECGQVSFASASGTTGSASTAASNGGAAASPVTGAANVSGTGFFDASGTQRLKATTDAQRLAIEAAVQARFDALDTQLAAMANTYINGGGSGGAGVAALINAPDTVTSANMPAPPTPQQLKLVRDSYVTGISDALARTAQDNGALGNAVNAMKNHAREDGFTTAGAWYMTMAQASYSLNQLAANIAPSIISSTQAPTPDESVWGRAYVDIITANRAANGGVITGSGNSGNQDAAWKLMMSQMGDGPWGAGGQGIVNWLITDDSGQPVMIRIKSIADKMVTLASACITASGFTTEAIEAAKKSTESLPLVGSLISAATTLATGALKPWLSMLTFVGQIAMAFFMMCSIYLPLVPFIIFMGQVLNWLISVVEGVAAAPFLAFAHFDTDGEGLGHKTEYGYVFMLQSFMKPVMLVLGFMFGCLLLETIGGYIMNIFPMVMATAQMDSVTGFFSILGFVAIFMVMMTGLVNTCMSVMYLLPDAIFAFIGARNSATAEVGRNEANHVIAAGATSKSIVNSATPGMRRMAQESGKGGNGGGDEGIRKSPVRNAD